MRVLYCVPHPLPLSESYVRGEIEWVTARGVEVGIWAEEPRIATGYDDPGRQYWVGPENLARAVDELRPDVVHAHPVQIGEHVVGEVERRGLPLTVRDHLGFAGRARLDRGRELARVRALADCDAVKKVWAFPQDSHAADHPKVVSLPAFYLPEHFYPAADVSNERLVLRAGTALPGKGLEEFMEIARLCPDVQFEAVLAVPDSGYVGELHTRSPVNVTFYHDQPREVVSAHMRRAPLTLRGHDPRETYGMPVSVVEAMACGAHAIYRDDPSARDYVDGAGRWYRDVTEAALGVREYFAESLEMRRAHWRVSVTRARRHSADALLPSVLEVWRGLVSRGV